MVRESVISSDLAEIGYDSANQILEVQFKRGEVYQYFDVPEYQYNSLKDADSKGKYFSQNIKNTYRYTRIS